MFTRSRWIHWLRVSFTPHLDLHKDILGREQTVFPPHEEVLGLELSWHVTDPEVAATLHRSITMMQISRRQIKMRQKLIKRFWRFCRACWGISIVEALLIAERVRYWTFSMMLEGNSRKTELLSGQEKDKKPVAGRQMWAVFF